VKGRLTLSLVLVGTAMLLIGVIAIVALLIDRVNCDGVSPATVCQGYTNSIHWAYPVIALGAACFIAAGLTVAKLGSGRRRTDGPASPPVTRSREGSSH
jgi:hypothetical protein